MSYSHPSQQQGYSQQSHPGSTPTASAPSGNPAFRGMHNLYGAPTPPLNSLSAFGSGGIGPPISVPSMNPPVTQQGVTSPMNVDVSQDGTNSGSGGGGSDSRRESADGTGRANSGSSTGAQPAAGDAGVFDFTKRKRWQSLLLTELTDTVVFALLPLSNGGAKVLYASPGIKQLLGYDPNDLEQRPLSEFIYEPDLAALLNNLHQSVLNRTDLASYHRFLPKSLMLNQQRSTGGSAGSNGSADGEGETDGSGSDSDSSSAKVVTRKRTDLGGKPVLLELRGHGYWGEEAERVPLPLSIVQGLPQSSPSAGSGSAAGERCKCFFMMARKWPSKTGEMLDSFLEEKMESERLRAEMLELAASGYFTRDEVEEFKLNIDPDTAVRNNSIPGLPTSYPYPSVGGAISTPSSHPVPPNLSHDNMSASSSASSNNYYDDGGLAGGAYDDDDSDPDRRAYVPPKKAAAPAAARKPPVAAATGEGGAPTKKAKKSKAKSGKSDVNHVCVTCGRTDSPEWRRGPMGPKTLCNSCGLRWKKSQKALENGGV